MLLQPVRLSQRRVSSSLSHLDLRFFRDESAPALRPHPFSPLSLILPALLPSLPYCILPFSTLTPHLLTARTRLIDRLTRGKVVLLLLLSLDQTSLLSLSNPLLFPSSHSELHGLHWHRSPLLVVLSYGLENES